MSTDPGMLDDLLAGVTVLIYSMVVFIGVVFLLVIFLVVRGLHSIHLNERLPGAYDDTEQFYEEESTALQLMDDRSRQSYLMAKRWTEHNLPNSADTDISLSQYMTIQEKAVAAWEFTSDILQQPMVAVHNRTEIDFRDSTDMCCVQTNLPLPKQKEVYYWETKIYDMAPDAKIAVGLTTKPYPGFRMPGMHRYSVSYESSALYRLNQPFSGITYGRPWQRGDVIGVGFRTRTGTVFFTHNGRKLDDVAHGMRVNLFPTVGATGGANLYVNLGQDGFVFIQANVKEWGLAPAQGSLAPPPAYGDQGDSLLLESTQPGPSIPRSSAPPYVQRRASDDAHHSMRASSPPQPYSPFPDAPFADAPPLPDYQPSELHTNSISDDLDPSSPRQAPSIHSSGSDEDRRDGDRSSSGASSHGNTSNEAVPDNETAPGSDSDDPPNNDGPPTAGTG